MAISELIILFRARLGEIIICPPAHTAAMAWELAFQQTASVLWGNGSFIRKPSHAPRWRLIRLPRSRPALNGTLSLCSATLGTSPPLLNITLISSIHSQQREKSSSGTLFINTNCLFQLIFYFFPVYFVFQVPVGWPWVWPWGTKKHGFFFFF